MKRSEYLARAGSEAKARREAAEAKLKAERALKRLALAGDELVATQADLNTIATTSTDPAAVEIAEIRKGLVGGTLTGIGRGDEAIP